MDKRKPERGKLGEALLTGEAFKPLHYQPPEETKPVDEDGITSGVIILPPIMTDTNPEMDSYPEDYVKYAQERMREYKREHGELPQWEAGKLKPPEEIEDDAEN